MKKLWLKDCRSLSLVPSEFSLRSHDPLWVIWPSVSLSLSLFLISLVKKLANCVSVLSFGFPVFRWSWWRIIVLSVAALMMVLLSASVAAGQYLWNKESLLKFMVRWRCPSDYQLCTMKFWISRIINSGMAPTGFPGKDKGSRIFSGKLIKLLIGQPNLDFRDRGVTG